MPILKPWRFACSCESLANALSSLRCSKEHTHSPCSGGDTVLTGFYPKMLTDIMVDNLFIGSESASVVYHQPPSGSLGFKPRTPTMVAEVIQPFVQLPVETVVDHRVCLIVQVLEPVREPESESDLYEFLINKGIQIGISSIATKALDDHPRFDKRILEYDSNAMQEEYISEKQNTAYENVSPNWTLH